MRAAGRLSVGIGYRRELHDALMAAPDGAIDFVELAPENYLGLGGHWRERLDAIRGKYPVVTHGLSLSLGGLSPLERNLIERLGELTELVGTPWHSDHLCWSRTEGAHFHELLPLPFTDETVRRTVSRIRSVSAALPVPLAVENISAYGRYPEDTYSEGELVTEIVERSGAGLLLDVNNVYVNAFNFRLDPMALLFSMPLEATVQIHIAGFHRESDDLVIDTHGAEVAEPVWPLLEAALLRTGPVPVLLERDHNIPSLTALMEEVERIRDIGSRVLGRARDELRQEVAHA